jgi:hypothetical protein
MKRALCIGVDNYPGTGMDLKGCVNDAMDWALLLGERGLVTCRIITNKEATRAALLDAIGYWVDLLKRGDTLFLTFSGHGSYIPDADGDEPDKRDECLCPYDVTLAGPIVDDELNALFVERAPGSKIVLIADSCFSGTIAKKASPAGYYSKPRFMPPYVFQQTPRMITAPARKDQAWITLSACKDHEVAYDAQFAGGRYNGAFTRLAINSFRDGLTYRDWMAKVRLRLPDAQYPQSPVVEGSWYARTRKAL